MPKIVLFILINVLSLGIISCKSDKKETQHFENFSIDKTLIDNDTIRLLSKYPELQLFNNEKLESKTRTAYIVQKASYTDSSKRTFTFDDYKCKAISKEDTLEIWLNNNNGYFGNGVLIKAFNGKFFIKDIDPKTLKGEFKLIKNSKIIAQKLVLNKVDFKKNDSIYGFIDYHADLDSLVSKQFRGYFKTKIR